MSEADDRCVLFFVKYPQPGRTKVRLSAWVGETTAVELYRNFVLDSLSTLENTGYPLLVCFDPPTALDGFAEWLGTHHRYLPQNGRDLGERMKNAFLEAFALGYRRAVLVGSDSPDLPGTFIHGAFSNLETKEVVVGPALDGGYYLIGFRKGTLLPKAFEGIRWSTDSVLSETLRALEKAGRVVHTLPTWYDMDTVEDVHELLRRNCNCATRCPRTMGYLLGNARELAGGHLES